MKIILVLVLVLACEKKQDNAQPAPAPVAKPEAKPAQKACELKLMVSPDHLSWEGANDRRGELAALDARAFVELTKPCSVNIHGDDKATYQHVITAMDGLLAAGVTDISLGPDVKGPTKKPPPPKIAPEIKGEVKSDGTLVATIDPDAKQDQLKDAPVIILTNTNEAKVNGKVIGKTDDADLAAKITAAIGEPKESLAILQADQSLPYAVIARAIEGAKKAGCDNVLFAVKNR